MEVAELLGYLLTGTVAGTLAGLFGVGGGVVVVPSLVFAFTFLGLPEALVTHMAIGTSLACMIPTSVSSTLGHNKSGNVDWKTFTVFVPAILAGSWLGVETAVSLSGPVLQKVLGAGLVLIAINMFLRKPHTDADQVFTPAKWKLVTGGGVIGCISAIFGIGGGIMTIPFLSRLGQSIRFCVGTSAACGVPIAVMGAIANIVLGEQFTGLPHYSTGLVYWPAFAGIVVMSIPCARLGANLAQKLPADKLARLFACMLMAVGLKFFFFS